jgi:hypothetical protein
MTEAFLEALPGAPTRGLVELTIGQNLAEAKGHGRRLEQPTERPPGEYRGVQTEA